MTVSPRLRRFASGQASAEEVKERQARSLSDPDIQNILKDPVMQQVRGSSPCQDPLETTSLRGISLSSLISHGDVLYAVRPLHTPASPARPCSRA